MKVACVIYHSNIYEIYKKDWIIDFFHSIHSQTYQDFDIIECCYDNSNLSLIELMKKTKIFTNKRHIFLNKKFKNNFECESYLFEYCFKVLNYDVCINTNIDDIYNENRFKIQMESMKNGADLTSSNYKIFQQYKDNKYERDIILKEEKDLPNEYKKRLFYTKMIIEKKSNIPFSSCTFTKNCWYNSNRVVDYPEIFYLTKSIINNKIKVDFNTEILLEHRIHNKQYSNKYKDKII